MVPSSTYLKLLMLTHTLLPLLHLTRAQSNYQNISSGSSLTPLGPNKSWFSPSSDFAFGFLPIETNTSSFLLAIWFAKIPSKTIVWYANGNNPVDSGASVKLTLDGRLVLKENNINEVWSSTNNNNNNNNNNTYAPMLNTGNFIVVGANNSILWQSFEEPSDTILPSQVLEPGTNLVSRFMDDDYSIGRFALSFTVDGNIGLYTVLRSIYSDLSTGLNYRYWPPKDTTVNGSQLVFDLSGTVHVSMRNNTVFNVTNWKPNSSNSIEEFYQRATVDVDGVFKHFVYPKHGLSSGNFSQGWSVVDYIPRDICLAIFTKINYPDGGSGFCGFNSYCVPGPVGYEYNYSCECPPQYSLVDSRNKYKGCKPDFSPQDCTANESEIQQLFQLELLSNVNWPMHDLGVYQQIDEEKCRRECLIDCFCAVGALNDAGICWKKSFPLGFGGYDSKGISVNQKTFVKVAKISQLPLPPHPRNKRSIWIMFELIFLGASALLNILMILKISLITYNLFSKRRSIDQAGRNLPLPTSLRTFSYTELEEATNGFNEELGCGASSTVYKGILLGEAETCIAVKKLKKLSPEVEKKFTNEVKAINRTYHKNLVRMLGFCKERAQTFLIFEFMSNGTLAQFLFEGPKPEWNKSIQIALGIARGLTYLHEECSRQIIHCDVKPQNILLDDNLVARIADFSLAKLLQTDKSRTLTDIRGTRGYVAPEWFKSKGISAKVDVYSFGIVLLEIICCRRNVELELENEEQTILSDWVDDCYRARRLDAIVDGDEEAILDMSRVERIVKVALWCIQEEPSLRPPMSKVTQMLDGTTMVSTPPDFASYFTSI